MNNDEHLFENYLPEHTGFSGWIKRPKSWVTIVSVLAAVILLIVFINSINDQMSPREVEKSIQLSVTDSRWVIKETTPYDVKIVPSITFTVKNSGSRPLDYVSFEGVFEFEDTGKTHTDGSAYVFNKIPLNPGQESESIVIKGAFGYTASSLPAFLKNKLEWKKMRVKIFARVKSSPPIRIGDYYPINQKIEDLAQDEESRIIKENETDPLSQKSFEKYGKAIQLMNVDSVWKFKLRTAARTAIVPTITFQVKNVGNFPLKDFIFKGEFYLMDTKEKLDEAVIPLLEKELPVSATSEPATITAALGYEGAGKNFVLTPETWKTCEVKLFAKQKDYMYILLGTYTIRRQVEGVR